MREIKFRVWNKNENMFIKDFEYPIGHNAPLLRVNTGELIQVDIVSDSEGFPDTQYNFLYGDNVLQQYTGLKDKNGVEIYEGDVLYIEDDYEKYGWAAGSTVEVVFETAKFLMKDNAGKYFFETSSEIQDGVTVRSNIYQNPELISN